MWYAVLSPQSQVLGVVQCGPCAVCDLPSLLLLLGITPLLVLSHTVSACPFHSCWDGSGDLTHAREAPLLSAAALYCGQVI